MREFHYDPKIYDELDKLVKGAQNQVDIYRMLYNTVKSSRAHNLLIGPIEIEERNFSIGFLARQPFSGIIETNPNLGNVEINCGIKLADIENMYKESLIRSETSIAIDCYQADMCSYFIGETKYGNKVFKIIKWKKNNVSIANIHNTSEYLEEIKNKEFRSKPVTNPIIKNLKPFVSALEFGNEPDFDEYYERLNTVIPSATVRVGNGGK